VYLPTSLRLALAETSSIRYQGIIMASESPTLARSLRAWLLLREPSRYDVIAALTPRWSSSGSAKTDWYPRAAATRGATAEVESLVAPCPPSRVVNCSGLKGARVVLISPI